MYESLQRRAIEMLREFEEQADVRYFQTHRYARLKQLLDDIEAANRSEDDNRSD